MTVLKPVTDCILSKRTLDGRGYPQTRTKQAQHRIVWRMRNGPIPEGYEIDHLCHNTRCINILHLDCVDFEVHRDRSRPTTCPFGHNRFVWRQHKKYGEYRECLECKRLKAKARRDERHRQDPDRNRLDKS